MRISKDTVIDYYYQVYKVLYNTSFLHQSLEGTRSVPTQEVPATSVSRMKVAVALVLLVAVSVNAHPGGHDRPCPPNSTECKCRKLMKPPKETPETGGPMTEAIAACETELSTQVPTGSGDGKRPLPPHHLLKNMPQEFKDCARDNVLRILGIMDDAGQISVTAMQSELTEKINANANKGDEITSAQVQTIVDAVPTCIADNGGDQLQMHEFLHCMTSACVDVLAA
ncbi:uncharacterized protein [Palaemon carinicauda]|uniref:uncharacterized protein isoform X1 n=1 Tax=Palaemon carinicauda TaxID=392227 RepID=UPI0035B66506